MTPPEPAPPSAPATAAASPQLAPRGQCRSCGAALLHGFVDLGMSPLCESFLTAEQLGAPETFYPLDVRTCASCFLVQLPEYVAPDAIFDDYAYFSSFSDSWLEHAARYTAEVCQRFSLGPEDLVVEVASNDGYLLRNFVERGIRSLGIEPAANVAAAARERGIETLVAFFGRETASKVRAQHGPARLMAGNNVLAHVPDIRDFVGGFAVLLAEDGVLTMEFPHLMRLIEGNQFDTIYHEHFSYLSLLAAQRVFEDQGLELFDVQELSTHGGSLRVFVQRAGGPRAIEASVAQLLEGERAAGYERIETYLDFTRRVERTKHRLLAFLIEARAAGKRVVAYGAPGKGNTLLNYCGIRTDLVEFAVDRNPYKHGRFTPGTHIPIHPPEALAAARPDYVLILPWNLRKEICAQLAGIREWGGQFVIPIPELEILPA